MSVTETDLAGYGLTVLSYTEVNDTSVIPAVQFQLKFGALSSPHMEQYLKDMAVMAKVRMNNNDAVKEAYDQLLTVMAISS